MFFKDGILLVIFKLKSDFSAILNQHSQTSIDTCITLTGYSKTCVHSVCTVNEFEKNVLLLQHIFIALKRKNSKKKKKKSHLNDSVVIDNIFPFTVSILLKNYPIGH